MLRRSAVKYRRNALKKVGIMVLALAMLFTGIAMAEPGGIEATKQISFIGENGAEITSTDNICLGSTCNTVEAGSSFTMSVVNARTETNNRFVADSPNTPLMLTHNIRVDSLGDIPSQGKVSAFMRGSVMEGRDTAGPNYFGKIEFSEKTMIDGYITLFDKDMSWVSGIKRV
jgi:hypothetical protein